MIVWVFDDCVGVIYDYMGVNAWVDDCVGVSDDCMV